MELSTLTRVQPIKLAISLADDVLNIEYDASACTIAVVGSRNLYDRIGHTLIDWDLTKDGQKLLPEGFDRDGPPAERAALLRPVLDNLSLIWLEVIAQEIANDFLDLRRRRAS